MINTHTLYSSPLALAPGPTDRPSAEEAHQLNSVHSKATADSDGDIVSWPLERQLESAVGLEELPIVPEWFPPNAHPDDINVLTSPLDRLVGRKAVPALDQGEVSATQAQDQSATGDFIK